MLFDARAHEPLLDAAWRPADVEAAIRTIARDAEEALRDGEWWPVHPLDAEDGDPAAFHGISLGAAGVLWALHRLAQAGLHEPRRDHARLADDVLDSWRESVPRDRGQRLRAAQALHTRTADETWLQRARRFATHSAGQVAAARRHHGHGRYSLWTGDLGTAMYLHQCLAGTSELPAIDMW
jgi:hypothetical protein